ncbi:MAG: hypothetical protein ACK42G_04295, partial [Candidatus Kapaibacteriota bacterium]
LHPTHNTVGADLRVCPNKIANINKGEHTGSPLLRNIMDFEGIGFQRKEEMFFNIIMPFMMVYSEEKEVQNFLKIMFEHYPPLSENKEIKQFKEENLDTEIANIKEYMGALFFQKTYRSSED